MVALAWPSDFALTQSKSQTKDCLTQVDTKFSYQ